MPRCDEHKVEEDETLSMFTDDVIFQDPRFPAFEGKEAVSEFPLRDTRTELISDIRGPSTFLSRFRGCRRHKNQPIFWRDPSARG